MSPSDDKPNKVVTITVYNVNNKVMLLNCRNKTTYREIRNYLHSTGFVDNQTMIMNSEVVDLDETVGDAACQSIVICFCI